MKKRLSTLFALSCSLCLAVSLLSACGKSFDARLKEEARSMTEKQCPQRVDNATMLDSLVYDETSRTLTRYFSVSPDVARVIRGKQSTFKNSLTAELKNDASWKECKDNGINFRFVYLESGTGNVVCEVTLGEREYK